MIKAKLTVLLVSLTVIGSLDAASQKPEPYYQQIAAKAMEGKMEITMPDRSICDILTEEYAIEVKKHPDWKDAIGQSLNYAYQSNKNAGIVLIVDKPTDSIRLMSVIRHYELPIHVWIIHAETLAITRMIGVTE